MRIGPHTWLWWIRPAVGVLITLAAVVLLCTGRANTSAVIALVLGLFMLTLGGFVVWIHRRDGGKFPWEKDS